MMGIMDNKYNRYNKTN